MRTIPGMTILNPADAVEARAAVEAAIQHKGPVYLRFGRYPVPVLFDRETYRFEIGKGMQMAEGNDAAVIAAGIMVEQALAAREILKNEGIAVRVINMPTIKPLDTEIILRAAAETGALVTAEEHNIIGGLGSAVAETVAESNPVPVIRVGIRDEFGRSGKVPALLEAYGLTAEKIADAVRRARAMR